MDAKAFETAREKVRAFCLPPGASLILIRSASGFSLRNSMDNSAAQLARLLLFLLQADPYRIADSDDEADVGPSFLAVPLGPARVASMAAALRASDRAGAFIIDLRPAEWIQLPFPLGQALNTLKEARVWERALRKRRRLGALLTSADTGLPREIQPPSGQSVLVCRDGRKLDMSSWLAAFSGDRCAQRESWRRRGYDTWGRS